MALSLGALLQQFSDNQVRIAVTNRCGISQRRSSGVVSSRPRPLWHTVSLRALNRVMFVQILLLKLKLNYKFHSYFHFYSTCDFAYDCVRYSWESQKSTRISRIRIRPYFKVIPGRVREMPGSAIPRRNRVVAGYPSHLYLCQIDFNFIDALLTFLLLIVFHSF